jgi:hypothetical protein
MEIGQPRQSDRMAFVRADRCNARLDGRDPASLNCQPDVVRPSAGEQGLLEMQLGHFVLRGDEKLDSVRCFVICIDK